MGDRASAERACKDPNPIIDGRKANVNLAILGAKPRGTVTPSGKCWVLRLLFWKCRAAQHEHKHVWQIEVNLSSAVA